MDAAEIMTSQAQERNRTVVVDSLSVHYKLRTRSKARGVRAVASVISRASIVEAVTDVSFELREGDVVGLVGGNGAGKSSLLRAVAGLNPASHGQVLASSPPLLLSVGAAMLAELSGRRNAYLGCLAQGMGGAEARAAAEEAIAFSGLKAAIERPLGTYSSGMAARLRFAIATVRAREILLVDEALSVGDKKFAVKAREKMRELSAEAGTVMLVSHSRKSLEESCNRGLWLEGGRLVMDAGIQEVLAAYEEHQDKD